MLQIKSSNNLTVFPTARAVREYINKSKSKNQLLEKSITIGDFFELSVLHKDNLKQIDKNLKIIYLKEAISSIDITKLGLSKDFSTFLKHSEYIFKFFLELSNEYVEFDELIKYDTYSLYSDHIDILKEVYLKYVALLSKYNYTDNILMPLEYIINSDYIEQFNTISIYLEGYLSKYEYNIISNISKLITINISINFNEYNQKNMNLFGVLEDDLKLNYEYLIDFTNKNILTKIKQDDTKQEVEIVPVSSKTLQVAFIKHQITQMISEGILPENIVVITPNEQASKQLALFDMEHYFNFAMGRDIRNNNIVKVIKIISKVLVDKEPKDLHKLNFYEVDNDKFINIFQNNWNNTITKEIFDIVNQYLLTFEENDDVIEKIEQSIISLELLLFVSIDKSKIEMTIKLKDYIKLLLQQILKITVDDTFGGKITVLGILETRMISYDGVIVIDFNDNTVPKISLKDKFISTNLKELVGLPTSVNRENLQRYYYQRIFQKAKKLSICYVDDDSSSMSRFIVQLFPNYKVLIVSKNLQPILFTKKDISYYYSELVMDIDLSKKEWSATSLKTYLTCKRKYYFNYISNIKEHSISIKPESFEVGNIIHNALEDAVKGNTLTTQYINNYLSSYQKMNPYLILELELWKKKLISFIEYEKLRAEQNIEVYKVEHPFNFTYKGVVLKGKIDRIDKHIDNSYEILDYKTSASLKIDTLKTYEESTDFQLEFYYLASRDKMIKSVGYYDLNNSSIKSETVLNEKLELLDLHIQALHTKTVNFKQTDNKLNCQFCPYKIICNK